MGEWNTFPKDKLLENFEEAQLGGRLGDSS